MLLAQVIYSLQPPVLCLAAQHLAHVQITYRSAAVFSLSATVESVGGSKTVNKQACGTSSYNICMLTTNKCKSNLPRDSFVTVVWTLKGTVIQQVYQDVNFTEKQLRKLTWFYVDYIIPEMVQTKS